MLVAVDESLGVTAELEARDHRAIPYAGTVRVKDVRDTLRQYEEQLVEQAAAALPAELRPEADVVTISTLAEEYGIDDASAALSELGYRVAWDGLSGGTVETK